MSDLEGKEFTGFCPLPLCGKPVDWLDKHYDYEHEIVVEVWFCSNCSLSIKVDPEDQTVLETMENLA